MRLFAAYSVLVWAAFTVFNVSVYRFTDRLYEVTFPVYQKVAEKMRSDPCYGEDASLFVWGYSPMFYYYAGLPVATRFVLPQTTIAGFSTGYGNSHYLAASRRFINPEHWRWLMADLERKHATYIVDTAPAALHRWNKFPMKNFPALQDFVKQNYTPMGVVDNVHLYRRKSCSQAPSEGAPGEAEKARPPWLGDWMAALAAGKTH